MLSNQYGIGDSNRMETDRAGWLGNRSTPTVSCGHLFTQMKKEKNLFKYSDNGVHMN